MAPEELVLHGGGRWAGRTSGFLTGQRDIAGWLVFTGHRHPCPADGSIQVVKPRMPPLSSGELVNTVQEVWCPTAWWLCTPVDGAPLVAIVEQRVSPKQKRSYAVVGLPGGQLAWARLFRLGMGTGLLVPSTPPASAPADEFAALADMLPEFLARHNANSVNNHLSGDGAIRRCVVPAMTVDLDPGLVACGFREDYNEVFEQLLVKHFDPVVNLKGLSASRLAACTSNQLMRLCLMAGISPMPDDCDLVNALVRLRIRSARSVRAQRCQQKKQRIVPRE